MSSLINYNIIFFRTYRRKKIFNFGRFCIKDISMVNLITFFMFIYFENSDLIIKCAISILSDIAISYHRYYNYRKYKFVYPKIPHILNRNEFFQPAHLFVLIRNHSLTTHSWNHIFQNVTSFIIFIIFI